MGIGAKNLIRVMFGGLFFYSGLFHMIRFFNNVVGRRLTIVTYHRIANGKIGEIEASLPFLFTSQQVFEKQLTFIKRHYNVIRFEDLIRWGANGSFPWNGLIITFDDGYEDNFSRAYRSLGKMNLPATFFVTVNRVGNKNRKPYWWDRLYYCLKEIRKQENKGIAQGMEPELSEIYEAFKENASGLFARMNKEETDKIERLLDRIEEEYQIDTEKLCRENRMLDWEQISQMSQNHDFGSHTCSHGNLLRLSDDQKDQEIVGSKKILEEFLNRKVRVFSSPAGHMSKEIEGFVKEGGYEFAVTAAAPGVNKITRANRYHLKRINIWEGTSLSLNGNFSKGYFSFRLLSL
jgi:peptidoglycan/xylan/chitin deacetylase (PgdA/CDA1 family)